MRWHRKHPKKEKQTIQEYQMQVLYNKVLDGLNKIDDLVHNALMQTLHSPQTATKGIMSYVEPEQPVKHLNNEEEYIRKANEAKSQQELTNVLLQMKKDKDITFFGKQRVEEATKHLFDNFFND